MTQEEFLSLKEGDRIFPIYFDGQNIGIPHELKYYYVGYEGTLDNSVLSTFKGEIKIEVILGQSCKPLMMSPNALMGNFPTWATEQTLERTCIQLIEEWKTKEINLANGILEKQQKRISELLEVDSKKIVKEQLKHKSHFNVV